MQNLDLLNERNDQVKLFFYSFIAWSALFAVLQEKFKHPQLTRDKSTDINNRAVSVIHGQFALWSACYCYFVQKPSFSQRNSNFMHYVFLISGGYFAYDVLVCIYYYLYDYWLLIHHFMTLIALGSAVVTKYSGAYIMSNQFYNIQRNIIIVSLFYFEISNLPMHLRIMIRDFGLRHTNIYESLEIIYFGRIFHQNIQKVLFIFARGFLSPLLLFNLWKDISTSILLKAVGTVMQVHGFYYIYEMKFILERKLKQWQERQKKKISYFWFTENSDIEKLTYPKYEKKSPIL